GRPVFQQSADTAAHGPDAGGGEGIENLAVQSSLRQEPLASAPAQPPLLPPPRGVAPATAS
ncbi:MAG: hypothetical protein ACRBN8_46955, partial [Nannocystales bacterium]